MSSWKCVLFQPTPLLSLNLASGPVSSYADFQCSFPQRNPETKFGLIELARGRMRMAHQVCHFDSFQLPRTTLPTIHTRFCLEPLDATCTLIRCCKCLAVSDHDNLLSDDIPNMLECIDRDYIDSAMLRLRCVNAEPFEHHQSICRPFAAQDLDPSCNVARIPVYRQ